ncbi:MAG: hypothetical protein AAB691_00595 [Patescibacteria group bacterium]
MQRKRVFEQALSYPAIAFLIEKEIIKTDRRFAEALKGIPWKDLNVEFKNDYSRVIQKIHVDLKIKDFPVAELVSEILKIAKQIEDLKLEVLGKKVKPPSGY